MEKKFKLQTPMMPNFILIEGITGMITDPPKIPVEQLSEQEANEYAELMRVTFMEHWKKKANERPEVKVSRYPQFPL